MHRNRTWQIDPEELRTQRNRILPIEGGDGSTLSLDFTTGVLDPRLTFTRSSNATFINSQGYVQYADANMLVNSPMQDAATTPSSWNFFGVTGGSISIPSTGSRKVEATASGQQPFAHQSPTVSQSLTYTLSLVVSEIVGAVTYANICAVDGSASRTLWVNGVQITNTATQAAAGNYCLVYVAGSGAHQHRIGVGASSATAGACSMTFHSARVQPGSFTTTNYVPSTLTSAYHGPRFDYDPTTLTPRGLLIEASAVNYVLQSTVSGFPSPWSTAGTNLPTPTVAYTGAGFAPDNISRPTRIQFGVNAGGSASRILQATAYTTNPTTAAPYTVSVWMKSNTPGTSYSINIYKTTGNNLVTVTDSWQRFTVVNTSGTSLVGYIYISNESTSVAADILIWGVQLEAGNGASSYIPTGASQGTRDTDSCVITGTNFSSWFNASAGTIFVNYGARISTGSNRVYTFASTDSTNQIFETIGSGTALNVYSSASFVAQIGNTGNTAAKYAAAYSVNDYAVSVAGSNAATDTLGALPVSIAKLIIGNSNAGTVANNGPIASFKYWPTRLPNAQLQSLTT